MANQEAIHECEDARDAEHIFKQAQIPKSSHVIKHTLKSVLQDPWEIDIENLPKKNLSKIYN